MTRASTPLTQPAASPWPGLRERLDDGVGARLVRTVRGVLREVARGTLPGRELDERRRHRPAHLLGLPAPGVEGTCRRRVDRRRRIALQPDSLAILAARHVR